MTIQKVCYAMLLTVFAASLSGCGGKKTEDQHDDHAEATPATEAPAAPAPQHEVSPEFRAQLTAVFDDYATLKDAFVASDPAKVKQQATAALGTLAKVDMKLLTGAPHHDWMTYLGGMEQSLKAINAAGDIEAQRVPFATLSTGLYKSIKAFGLDGQTAYYEYCPMAFDDKGAYWLAKEEQIRNPYFGDRMLTCGSVQETLN